MALPLPPFTISEHAPGRFSLSGELDLATAPRLHQLADVHGPILLDLQGVTFIDSSGIAKLLRLYRRCEHDGCSLQIEACSDRVESVLRLVDLYDVFTDDGDAAPQPLAPEIESGAEGAEVHGAPSRCSKR